MGAAMKALSLDWKRYHNIFYCISGFYLLYLIISWYQAVWYTNRNRENVFILKGIDLWNKVCYTKV
jgi:hypothetical protein